MRSLRRLSLAALVALCALTASAGSLLANGPDLAAVRAVTARFHDLTAAEAAGYGAFYVCTDDAVAGAMGQHFVNGALAADPAIDPLHPEALVYAPRRGGGYRLVAVEYVVIAADWLATHSEAPSLFGQAFTFVSAGNRFGLPPFYALHAWIWDPNPSGMFASWNPRVSCLGNGDPA